MKDQDQNKISALKRAFQVLEAFNSSSASLTNAALVEKTGLGKSAVQRFTHTLSRIGYLKQNPKTKTWSLTHRSARLAHAYLSHNKLVEVSTPYLVTLATETNSLADLAVLDDDEVLYIMRVPRRSEAFSFAPLARRWPALTSAPGRAMISQMPKESQDDIILNGKLVKFTPNTILDRGQIRELLESAGTAGYAWQAGETTRDAGIVAAAIHDRDGNPLGAIALSLSADRISDAEELARLGKMVKETAAMISALNL